MTGRIWAVFALTYALILVRRLRWLPIGRPAGALLGAVAMVAVGGLTPAQSYAAIDHDTIALLLGMMLLAAHLEEGGVFERVVGVWVRWCPTPGRLLVGVSATSAVLSAWLVNDTVCLVLTPLVVRVCARHELPFLPYLLAVATSANVGSAATLIGNPQNMLIGSMSGIGFTRFALLVGPATLVAWALNLALLWVWFRRVLGSRRLEVGTATAAPVRGWRYGVVVLGVAAGFVGGLHMGYTALAGALALMVAARRDSQEAFARVDWPLLIFFAGLFVVIGGVQTTGVVDALWSRWAPAMTLDRASGLAAFTGALCVGANTVSNVPLVLLLGPQVTTLGVDPELAWALLGFVSTVAGNLTLLGSVANLIVAERAREHCELGFWAYTRFGAVSALVSLAAGVPLIVLTHGWV